MENVVHLVVPPLEELLDLPTSEVQDLFHRELLRAPHADTIDAWIEVGRMLVMASPDAFLTCQVSRFIAIAESNNGRFPQALADLQRAEEIAAREHLTMLLAECKNSRGIIEAHQGHYAAAVRLFDEGLDLVDAIHHPAVTASLKTNMGLALDHMGQTGRAIDYHLGSIAIREEQGNHRGLASSYFNLAELHARRGEYDAAYEFYLRALDLQEQSDDVNTAAQTRSAIAYVIAKSGDADEACRLQDEAESMAKTISDVRLRGVIMGMRSSILATIGKKDESRRVVRECLDFARTNGLVEMEVHMLENIARDLAEDGHLQESIAMYEEALSTTQRMHLRWLEGVIARDLARVLIRTDQRERAPALLTHALQIFHDAMSVDDELAALLDLAHAYRAMQAGPEAIDAMAAWASEIRKAAGQQMADRIKDIRRQHRHERIVLEAHAIARENNNLLDAMERQRELVRVLEEVNAEKDEFMMVAAHDLRNPLGLVKSMLHMIMKHADTMTSEDIIDLCGDMHSAVDRMQSLVRTFLDVSRSADDPSRLRLADVNVCAIVMSTAQRHMAEAKRKKIGLTVPEFEEIMVHADPAALEEIVDNLITNAIKFCTSGCTVDVRVVDAADVVCVHVNDNGPGLSPDDVQRAFTKYGKLTPRPTAGEESNGLGLYLSQRLAQRMGGRIRCESEVGRGTDFIICLPPGQRHTDV